MNADQLTALLGAWVAAVPRLDGAQCLGRTDLADLEIRSPRAAIDEAIGDVCLNCRELLRCAEWVDSLPADQRPRGVVGGRMVDPDAPRTARAVMLAELKARRSEPDQLPLAGLEAAAS